MVEEIEAFNLGNSKEKIILRGEKRTRLGLGKPKMCRP
jgi:hypothetical protein